MTDIKLHKNNIIYEFYQHLLLNPKAVAFYIQKNGKEFNLDLFDKVSFSDLFDMILVFAKNLVHRKLVGKRIVILHPPNKDVVALILAMFLVGAVPVFIDPNVGLKHLKICIKKSTADVLLTTPLLKPLIPVIYTETPRKTVISPEQLKKTGLEEDLSNSMTNFDCQNIAGVFFTSGSTGTPKGVIWTHKNIKGQLDLLKQLVAPGKESTQLALFPLFLIYGPLLGHSTVWLKFNLSKPINIAAKTILNFLQSNKIDYTFGSPIVWKNLLSYCSKKSEYIPNMKVALCGGAPLDLGVINKIQDKITQGNFYITYGATEALPISYYKSSSVHCATKVHGVLLGEKFKGVNVKIKASSKKVNVIPSCNFRFGEILVQGDHVTKGYIHEPVDTSEKSTSCTSFHYTGDYGYLDDNNNLWYYGRGKHAIQSGNSIYYPVPIEALVKNIIGTVFCTIYVKEEKLFLILEKRQFSKMGVSEETLIKKINNRISHSKICFSEVLFFPKKFPVDRRHYSKLDRSKIQKWASKKIAL